MVLLKEQLLEGRVSSPITISALYRYPVKGMSAQVLDSVHVDQFETFPFDRAYAIENGPSRFDPGNPQYTPPVAFLMLMRHERLATLAAEFDEASQTLTLRRGGKQVARGDLTTRSGRAIIEQFIAAYMDGDLRGPPHIVHADGHSFTDSPQKAVHIINRATVADLERVIRRPVDPLRFRPNIILDGLPAWSEFNWVGKELRIGSAGARLDVFERVDRCAATNVDPKTGARDADIPAALQRQWGHTDLGVYAKITERGTLTVGDVVKLPG